MVWSSGWRGPGHDPSLAYSYTLASSHVIRQPPGAPPCTTPTCVHLAYTEELDSVAIAGREFAGNPAICLSVPHCPPWLSPVVSVIR